MSFKKVIFSLEEPDVVRLIGRAATLADFENLQPPEVVAVLHAVVKATSDDLPDDDEPAPVPRDKLRYNAITGAVARKIAMGQTNADIVRAHIDNDPNPLLGITLANEFRRRYNRSARQREKGLVNRLNKSWRPKTTPAPSPNCRSPETGDHAVARLMVCRAVTKPSTGASAAVLLEANDEWQLQHRYMQVEGMAGLAPALSEESITTLPPQAA